MQTATKKLDELKRPEKNVRIHGERQIKEYIRSIEMFGQIRPLVIDEDNVVLAGNGLLTALNEMGRETADCYVVAGLSAKDKKKLMLADNKIFDLGANDTSAFDEILRELGGDVDIPGYDVNLLQSITASFNAPPLNTISTGIPPRIQVKVNSSAATQSQPLQNTSPVEEHGQQSVQRFVTCPKCGEKIYL